ncbi:MAG: T9SS type A sorting domain-containing protein [Bacteroidota bacterium]
MSARLLQFYFFIAALFIGGNAFATGFTISVSPNDTICHGTIVTFTAGTTGSYGYIWKVNGIPAPSITSTFTTTTLNNNDAVKCLLTNAAGDTILFTSNTITMTVDSLPPITPILGGDSVCLGSTLQLYDSTHGGIWGSSNTTYATVDLNNGLVSGLSPTPNLGPNQLRIVYIMTNNCGSDTVRFRVRVHQPAGPIMLTGNNPLCIDSFANIRDTARGGLWSFSDTTISKIVGPFGTIQGLSAGTVSIYYNLTNACGSMADTMTLHVINCDTPTSVAHANVKEAAVNIYPNPNTGTFNIHIGADHTTATCIITNMLGVKVQELNLNGGSTTAVSMNTAGIYFILVQAGAEHYTTKLIVQ